MMHNFIADFQKGGDIHSTPQYLMDHTARAGLFILTCIDTFSFCFYGFWRLNILDTPCKLFQYTARYLANLTQLLFIYLQYVNNKYSEISIINDKIFHNFPGNEIVTLPLIFSSHEL